MGGFDVDIVARYKKDYAIGITLNEEDLDNPESENKIHFLATGRQSRPIKRYFFSSESLTISKKNRIYYFYNG